MSVIYNFVKEILSQVKWQKKNLHVYNIQKIIEKGEENVLLLFILKFKYVFG